MALKAIWQQNTAYSKLLLSVGIILIGAVLFTIISMVAAMAIYGVSMLQLQTLLTDYNNPTAISVLKLIQTISSVGIFIVPAFVIAYLFSNQPMEYLFVHRRANMVSALLVVVILILSTPLINFIGEINSHLKFPESFAAIEKWMRDSEDKAAELTKQFLVMKNFGDVVFNIFMIALLPALGEELLFRGVIQRIFTEWSKNIHVGIWMAAFLFSAMHMQFYGFFPRLLLGAMMGYLLVWSGSLWLPIIAHFVNNATAVFFTYLFDEKIIAVDADKIGTEGEMASVLISALIVAGLLLVIYRREKSNRVIIESS
jgi:membrane protease YdiL (CAAX protease family)